MKSTVHFTNSPNSARKTNQAYKKANNQQPKVCTQNKSIIKETAKKATVCKQNGIYNQWLMLCGGLCLSFLLLITSGDSIKSFSRSDGVVMISEYLKEKIDSDGSIAVFFGIESGNDKNDKNAIATPQPSVDDVPVFQYGEGLSYAEYIEKYNGINNMKTGEIPVMGVISSEYSFRKNPFYSIYEDEPEYEFHAGIDIAADEGDDIVSYLDGVVERASLSASYGYYICIDHENGMKTLYAHASELLCEVGDRVSRGQVIAKVGSTGRATGPHLHFEVIRDGYTVNPKEYLGALYEQN